MFEPGVPTVSVIMPAYGRAELIQQAIASCAAEAEHVSLEVIVIDDASPVSLGATVIPLGVTFRRLDKNAGSSIARNLGLTLARGEYVKFLDSDDVLCPSALAQEVARANDTGADIVVGGWRNVTLFDAGESRVDGVTFAPVFDVIADDLLAGRAVPTSAALYRRSRVQDVRWDSTLSKLNDWDYFVQAALVSSSIVTCPIIAYDWRAHAGERITSSSSFLKNSIEFYVILNKLIESLDARGALSESRRRRAAQYLYKELRGLYRFDAPQGRSVLQRIRDLDSKFVPLDEEQSRYFRLLGQFGLLGPALEGYGIGRRMLDRLARRSP